MSPITLRRPPGGTPTSTRGRRARALSFATVISLLATLLSLTGIGSAANAAPGDYTVSLAAPPTVQVGSTYNYVATVDFEGVDSSNPSSDVVLTTTLPVGTEFVSVPEGPSEVVASHTYDPVTRVLTLTLNDTTQDLVSVAYTVGQVDRPNKYEGFPLDATISGTGGPSGTVSSLPVQTLVTGLNDFFPSKDFTVLTGGNNRTVTYDFNMSALLGDLPSTFSAHAQQFTDVFPAGTVLVGASGGPYGTWDTSAFPTAVFNGNTIYNPGGTGLDYDGGNITITVYYPDIPGWEDGASPQANVVSLRTQDANGVWYDQPDATVQAPPFMPGSGPHLSVEKFSMYQSAAGGLGRATMLNASYVGNVGDPDVAQLVLTDTGATGESASAWFHHNRVFSLDLKFNATLKAAALPYTVEYQTNWSSAWQTYPAPTPSTAANANIGVQNVGSIGWAGTTYLNLPLGEVLTGWRVSVAPGAETVPPGSEILSTVGSEPVFRDLADNILPTTAPTPVTTPGGIAPGVVTNVGTVSDGTTTLSAEDSFTPLDSVYLTTIVEAPTSMSVGGGGSYVAKIVNQNPSEIYTDARMSVVLPCGVFYDESAPIEPLGVTVGVSPAPAIGAGVTVDATERVVDANGCEQQVVTFLFDEIAPMRPPGVATDRWVENSGWSYEIPVVVLAQAYDPADTSVPVTSYVYTGDPRFVSVDDGGTNSETVPIRGYGGFIGTDNYDFDPYRTEIAVWTGATTINTGGGLLISKLSAASADGPWGLSTEIGTDAFWQIYVSDILPNPVSNLTFFDKLPSTADGDAFSVTLSGAVTGAPAGATVEYSIDATSGSTGTWTTDPTGATAFRVVLAQMVSGDNFTLVVPTAVEGSPDYGDVSDNVVTSSATYGNSVFTAQSNLAEVVVGATADIDIVKKTNSVDVPDAGAAPVVPAGSVVEWTYEVTNNGTTTLDDVTVTDAGGPDGGTMSDVTVTAPAGFSGSLAPGESVVFTATGLAIAGLYHNVAVTSGTPVDSEGTTIPIDAPTATDESWYTGDGSGTGIAIVKKTNGIVVNGSSEAPELLEGADVEWTYEVTNIGTVILDDVTVTDMGGITGGTPAGVTVTAPTGFSGTLAPGESVVFTASGMAVAGLYHNVAVTTGVPVDSDGDPLDITPPTATDDSWYTGDPLSPGIVIVKKTNGKVVDTSTAAPEVAPGSTVSWTFEVTNTGNTVLTDVAVTDIGGPATGTGSAVKVSAPTGFDGSLDPGETVIFTASGTAISGLYHNVSVVVATPVDGGGDPVDTVNGTDESWYTGTVAAVITNPVLAFTGLGTNSIIWAALSLLIIGGALTWVRTRERRASQNG